VIPTSPESLVVLLLAIVPGYLAIYFWSRNKTWKGLSNDLQTVLKAVALSAVIQVLLAPLTIYEFYPVREHLDRHPIRLAIWLAIAVLILPYILGTVVARISDRLFPPGRGSVTGTWAKIGGFFVPPSPEPTVWDWAVTAGKMNGKYVLIEFKNGRKVAGVYEAAPDNIGMALTNPEQQGIYLSREFNLTPDGDFEDQVQNSAGLIVLSLAEVLSIRVLSGRGRNEQ
jgi:hypothetical protein